LAIEHEVFLDDLSGIQRLSHVGYRRMKILRDCVFVGISPEEINQRLLWRAALAARGETTEAR
jgi:hypothetical protein